MKQLLLMFGIITFCFCSEEGMKREFYRLKQDFEKVSAREVKNFLTKYARDLQNPQNVPLVIQLLNKAYDKVSGYDPDSKPLLHPVEYYLEYFLIIDALRTALEGYSTEYKTIPEWKQFDKEVDQRVNALYLTNPYYAFINGRVANSYSPFERAMVMAAYAQKLSASNQLRKEIRTLFNDRIKILSSGDSVISAKIGTALFVYLPDDLLGRLLSLVSPDTLQKWQRKAFSFTPAVLTEYLARYPTAIPLLLAPNVSQDIIEKIMGSPGMTADLFDELMKFFTLNTQQKAAISRYTVLKLLLEKIINVDLLKHMISQAFTFLTKEDQQSFFNNVVDLWVAYVRKIYDKPHLIADMHLDKARDFLEVADFMVTLNPLLKPELSENELVAMRHFFEQKKWEAANNAPVLAYLHEVEKLLDSFTPNFTKMAHNILLLRAII